ncbi:hypothetical protein [Sphingobium amiense]|uniref:hypothetical protein n=1 Tax=Sphingobium amiense TaxID=135719 RepID=UPI000835D855|nr:hypothetical protein [Sphingobium amiense]
MNIDLSGRVAIVAGTGGDLGRAAQVHVILTQGTPEKILARMGEVGDRAGQIAPGSRTAQGQVELADAGYVAVASVGA